MRQRVALKSAINDKTVCADRNMKSPGTRGGVEVRANRDNFDAPGPWEDHEAEFHTDGTVSFRSMINDEITALWSGDPELPPPNRFLLCANRPDQLSGYAGPAERWQPVFVPEATRFNGTETITNAWALKNVYNGLFLSCRPAKEDPLGRLFADAEWAGENQLFYSSVPLIRGTGGGAAPRPPLGGGAGVPGPLRVSGRGFASPAGRFDYREVSGFALYSLWLQKRFAEIDAFLSAMAPYAAAVRPVLTLDGDFWNGRGYHCGPDMPGFYDELPAFAAHCAARGFYVRFCMVGAIEPFGGVWFPDRRDVWTPDLDARVRAYLERAVPMIGLATNALIELANEPGQIGLRSSFDKVMGWGRLAKRLAPHLLMNFAAVDGPNDGDTTFIAAPADFVDTHIHRMKEYEPHDGWNGWLWVKRSSEHPIFDNDHMPAMSGEPINFGSVGVGGRHDVEASPAIAMAYGATSRLRRYLTNFHFEDGLWCRVPNAETIACLEGWKRGLDAIPFDFDGGWCNGHHGCSPWDSGIFPTSDDVRHHTGPVRIFGRGGPGNYIGASIREVVGHRPRARRPVEEVTRLEWGGYACAVYRA